MGSIELSLLLKYGVPLAVKLLSGGKDEVDTVDVVDNAITGIASGDVDVTNILLAADKEQTKSIVEGIYGIITGASDALANLVKGLSSIFTPK